MRPAAAHADPAAATAQHDRPTECLDGQPALPPAVPPLAAAPASTNKRSPPSTASDAARVVRFRPWATNEWDRMPAEIQNKILAHAGVLALWLNGRIDDAKIDLEQFKSMLCDVFELDWQGDLIKLPFARFYGGQVVEQFWRIRSRSMHARVKALGIISLNEGLDQAAMLNMWTDLLDFGRSWELGRSAMRCGSVAMLEYLVDERKAMVLSGNHAELVAEHGHLVLFKWLHRRIPNSSWSTWVMDNAAAYGHLDCIKWLHMNRTEGCTTRAMNNAASNRHLYVIKWLHVNRTEGCTKDAMNNAASNGHLDVVKWLHANRTEGCTVDAMDCAAGEGHIDIVRWLHANRTEGCTTRAMNRAASSGHLALVEWLHANRTEGCSGYAMRSAAQYGHADVVEFLYKNRTEGSIAEAAKVAAQNSRLAVIRRISDLAPDVITGAVVNEAASFAHVAALEWLVGKTGVLPTADALSFAVQNGHLRILPWFRKRMPDMFRSHAASKLDNESADSVIDWFDQDNLPASPTSVMRLAIKNNLTRVIEWLKHHVPERLLNEDELIDYDEDDDS
ncbi:hypothetical protein HK105_201222 [Polyrhizophydium stewartii]|uniref:Ankyrin repeat protein n=1 Tax=Polyrhizophydium stewartii TaxID=2732419 RepID=A0ABR4NHF5_9FUNG